MLRNSLLVSALLVVSTLGFANNAKAQTASPVQQPLRFTAKVAPSCDLANPVSGALTVNGGKTAFSTQTKAKIDINCTNGTLTISDPVADGTNPTAAATAKASLTTPGSISINSPAGGGKTSHTLTAADVGTANVSMDATAGGAGTFAPGDYGYTVTVTATP